MASTATKPSKGSMQDGGSIPPCSTKKATKKELQVIYNKFAMRYQEYLKNNAK